MKMNKTMFSPDVLSDNVLLLGGILAFSLAGMFYILQYKNYIFNDDELSTAESLNNEIKDVVETPDSPKANVVDETSPLPSPSAFGKSDDPSLEITPKGKSVELSNDDDETLSEHSSTSSSSSSSSRTVNSDFFRNNDQPLGVVGESIDYVERVSDYKSALDSSILLNDKTYFDKEIQTMNVDTISSSTQTSSVEPSILKTLIDTINQNDEKLDKLRKEINQIYSKKVDELYGLNLKLIDQNKSMQDRLLSIFNKETKDVGVLTQSNTISKGVLALTNFNYGGLIFKFISLVM